MLTTWPLPCSPSSRGCPEPTQPRRRRPVCVDTHTHTCCMHPPHAHTSPYTDLHKNRHTHTHVCTHPYTGTHISMRTGRLTNPPSRKHVQAHKTHTGLEEPPPPHRPVIYFERTSLPQSWSTSANSANFREPGPSGSQPFLLPPEGATTKPMEPQSSTSQDPHGPVLGRAFQGHRRPSSHISKTFGSQFSPKLEDDRTCPCLYHETEGSGGCSRTFCQEEVGAAAAGDGAGQA